MTSLGQRWFELSGAPYGWPIAWSKRVDQTGAETADFVRKGWRMKSHWKSRRR